MNITPIERDMTIALLEILSKDYSMELRETIQVTMASYVPVSTSIIHTLYYDNDENPPYTLRLKPKYKPLYQVTFPPDISYITDTHFELSFLPTYKAYDDEAVYTYKAMKFYKGPFKYSDFLDVLRAIQKKGLYEYIHEERYKEYRMVREEMMRYNKYSLRFPWETPKESNESKSD